MPGGAVDRAGDVDQQRPDEHVVGALLGGAHARPRPREQLPARERAVQVVVGARVERRVRPAALGRDGDREQPRVAELDALAQRAADAGRVQPGRLAVHDHEVGRLVGQQLERGGGVAYGAWRVARGAQPRGDLRLDGADHEHARLAAANGFRGRHPRIIAEGAGSLHGPFARLRPEPEFSRKRNALISALFLTWNGRHSDLLVPAGMRSLVPSLEVQRPPIRIVGLAAFGGSVTRTEPLSGASR